MHEDGTSWGAAFASSVVHAYQASEKMALKPNRSSSPKPSPTTVAVDGVRKRDEERSRGRLVIGMGVFALCFAIVGLRLTTLAMSPAHAVAARPAAADMLAAARPDIVDRNGEVLATDIKTPSLYAEPRKIIDVDEAVERLTQVLPELDQASLRKELSSDRGFVFVKRELTPRQQAAVFELGVPGVGFLEETRRVYPAANTAAYVLGAVDVDQGGISGIEKFIDEQGLKELREAGMASQATQRPIEVSLDLRVQHSLRDELSRAMEAYQARAAAGVVMNVRTGEIVAMNSLPDYDPNVPAQALDPERMNRVASAVYEVGSVFKVFTYAMAFDNGTIGLDSVYDATNPIRVASFTINDFYGARRPLTVTEAFTKSSNIAAAKVAMDVGTEQHQAFLRRLGFFDRLRTELPESAAPLVPPKWGELSTMTIAFGHGISVTPLQVVAAGAAIVNGGSYIPPTFLPRTEDQAQAMARQVISPSTSETMRYLMRLNAETGTAKRANTPGFRVGGKTGTAEKIVDGRYSDEKRLTSFLGAFPMDDPQYMVFILMDEPQGTPETGGVATSSANAVPTAGRLIARIAPMLGVAPKFEETAPGAIQVAY